MAENDKSSKSMSPVNKKILIIGAGFGQVPAIKKAQELGVNVTVIDRNPDAIGMELADQSFVVDIIDKEAALALSQRLSIDGVMTLQSDHGVPSVGYINDNLGLKGVTFETAVDCSNKKFCRKRLKEKNCSQPRFEIASTHSDALKAISNIGYPAVIKAVDSSGSRGVTKIRSEHEIGEAIKEAFKYSNDTEFLIEEYIEGIEFGAQTFSVNGKCELVILHNDQLSNPPYMIPVGHSLPFTELEGENLSNAISEIKKAVEAIGIYDGPANVDVILDQNTNEVKTIEIGARIGATCLPELVSYHTGIDWVKESIKSALGVTPNLEVTNKKPVAARIVESPKDGLFQSYEIKDLDERVVEFEINVSKGERVSILRKGTDRIGKVIAMGENVGISEDICIESLEKIEFEID